MLEAIKGHVQENALIVQALAAFAAIVVGNASFKVSD
jgi:hypothetical protein